MWRLADVVPALLLLVTLATFWCVVHAQSSNADAPCDAVPAECVRRVHVRYWWTTMWGFIVTWVALTMEVWGYMKVWKGGFWGAFLMGALNPLDVLWKMMRDTACAFAMLGNLREGFGDAIVAPMYPWSKSHVKIIVDSLVLVNLPPDVYEENHNLNAFYDAFLGEASAEALVVGKKVADSEQYNVALSYTGRLALLRSNVLPPYDELKFLRGSTSLGMAIATAQAVGYIYGVFVRSVQGLRVSPIEVMACVLNIVILMKGVLNNYASISHRPLLLYLRPEEEERFLEECRSMNSFELEPRGTSWSITLGCGFLLALTGYFIGNSAKTLNRACVVPIVLFEVSLVLGGIHGFVVCDPIYLKSKLDPNMGEPSVGPVYLILVIVVLNSIGYVWALVVTFKYWKVEGFDVQSSNYLSQVLPYIG